MAAPRDAGSAGRLPPVRIQRVAGTRGDGRSQLSVHVSTFIPAAGQPTGSVQAFGPGRGESTGSGPAHSAGGHTPAVTGEAIALAATVKATEQHGVEISQAARTWVQPSAWVDIRRRHPGRSPTVRRRLCPKLTAASRRVAGRCPGSSRTTAGAGWDAANREWERVSVAGTVDCFKRSRAPCRAGVARRRRFRSVVTQLPATSEIMSGVAPETFASALVRSVP